MSTLRTIPGGRSPQPTSAAPPAPSSDTLTEALADTQRMASILSTLLQDRITDTGRSLTIHREDAKDIRFAAEQLLAMLGRAGEIWRAVP